jgi:hypothetical protein
MNRFRPIGRKMGLSRGATEHTKAQPGIIDVEDGHVAGDTLGIQL